MTYIHIRMFGLGALVLCGLLAGFAAYAQENGTTSAREALQGRIEERREEIKEEIMEKRAEIASSTTEFTERVEEHRAALAKKLQERLYNLTQNIKGRMEAAIFRLTHIADRIESRTALLKAEQNIDDVRVQEELSRARAELSLAQSGLTHDLGDFAYTENPREAFKKTREILLTTGGHIRAAHEALRSAFAALKDAVAGTSTAEGVSDAMQQNTAASSTIE